MGARGLTGLDSAPDLSVTMSTTRSDNGAPRRRSSATTSREEFAWAVGDADNPSAIWRFRLTPRDGGTNLSYWMQMGPAPSGLSVAIESMPDKEEKIVFVRLREFEAAISKTLAAIKRLAEHGVR